MRSRVAVAVAEDVAVLPMQVLHDGAWRNGRRPYLAAELLLCKAAERQAAQRHSLAVAERRTGNFTAGAEMRTL